MYGIPFSKRNGWMNRMAKSFHEQNKKVERKWASLLNSSSKPKLGQRDSISQNLHGWIRDRRHNNFFKIIGDTCCLEGIINEISSHSLVSFLQIYFNHHPLHFILTSHRMDYLLRYNNIINNVPTYNKTSLLLCNNFRENILKTVSNYLHRQLEKERPEIYWMKMGKTFQV